MIGRSGRTWLDTLGILAVGLALLLGAYTGGVWVGRSRGSNLRAEAGLRPVAAVPATPREEELRRKVAAHPFWRVRVTPAQVEDLVRKIRAEERGAIVFVDDGFRFAVVPGNTSVASRSLVEQNADRFKPAAVGERFFYIDLFKAFRSRPTPEAATLEILAAVRARHHED